jgi:hypothetical protein
MPDAHSEEQDVWSTLLDAGFLHALKDAHEETTLTVFGALSRAAGFKERSFGYTAYDVLESQLDHVFKLGTSAEGSPADPLTGKVVRDNLNGSPGWRYGGYRILLKRHEFGAVDAIRWDQLSHTKQAVSRQGFGEDPQLALELDLPAPSSDTPGLTTLVLAHSASESPLQMELFFGRPRFNADGGSPWWWCRPLTRDTLGPDPRRVRPVEPMTPLWSDDEADVPLRLRGDLGTEKAL